MHIQRFRRRLAAHCLWWCLFGVLLMALQPFIATHFRQDGWEDEPGFRIRSASAPVQFEPDERADHAGTPETTLFVPAAASTDLPSALQHGIDGLLALVWALLPLTIALTVHGVQASTRARPERVPNTSGAPPLTAPWFSQPPKTAPPSPN